MKFLCPNCKAKYQISDEKISGRTLKMDCRRCSHPIVIRGDKVDPAASASAARRPSGFTSQPGVTPRRRGGSYTGPAPTSRSSSRTPLGAEFRKQAAAPVAAQKPTALDQWHVAINDVPVGPMKRDEVARKMEAGAIDGESLAWREGFDDWRPVKDIPELAQLMRKAPAPKPAAPPPPSRSLGRTSSPPAQARAPRPAQQSRPGAPAGRPDSVRPAARGNVVPIHARSGAAPAIEEHPSDDLIDDEPTRVGSAIDFEKLEEEQRIAREREQPPPPEPMPEPVAAPQVAAPPGVAFAESDAFDPFASQRAIAPVPPVGGPFAQPPPSGIPPAASYQPMPQQFAPPPVSVPPERRRSLPIGAWIAIAGAMAFGVALAVMLAAQLFKEPVQPQVVINQPQPIVQQPEVRPAELDVDVPDPPPAQVEQPAQEEAVQPGNATQQPRRVEGQPQVGAERPRPAQQTQRLDPEAAARLARAADDGAETAPIQVPRNANNPLNESARAGGGELSADQIRSVVNRERAGVQRCYETAARAFGQAPDMRIDVDLTIGGGGTVTSVTARGRTFGDLSECVERTVRRWRFPATGGQTRTSIPFVFQGREQ